MTMSEEHFSNLEFPLSADSISLVIMVFVNYGGGRYWFFKHESWNGEPRLFATIHNVSQRCDD